MPHALAIQSDGKILVAGDSDAFGSDDFALARYNADGSLDTSFGPGHTGLVTTDFGSGSGELANALAIQSDGKILVAGITDASGSGDFALARYNADGSLDASFGPGTGLVTTDFGGGSRDVAYALAHPERRQDPRRGHTAMPPAAWISLWPATTPTVRSTPRSDPEAAGSSPPTLAAVFPTRPSLWPSRATARSSPRGTALPPGTYDFALARYDGDGSLDLSFGPGGSGLVTTDFGGGSAAQAYALAVQSDGKILAAGIGFVSGNNDFALARYTITLPVTAVPALDGAGLALLVLLLAVTALVVVGRHG